MTIATGVGIEKVKLALKTLNGGVAFAVGVALVAIGSAFKSAAGQLGTSEVLVYLVVLVGNRVESVSLDLLTSRAQREVFQKARLFSRSKAKNSLVFCKEL